MRPRLDHNKPLPIGRGVPRHGRSTTDEGQASPLTSWRTSWHSDTKLRFCYEHHPGIPDKCWLIHDEIRDDMDDTEQYTYGPHFTNILRKPHDPCIVFA